MHMFNFGVRSAGTDCTNYVSDYPQGHLRRCGRATTSMNKAGTSTGPVRMCALARVCQVEALASGTTLWRAKAGGMHGEVR